MSTTRTQNATEALFPARSVRLAANRGRVATILGAIVVLYLMGGLLAGQVDLTVCKQHSHTLDALWAAMAVVYILVMALPFVPGIEIGLALMLVLGDCGIVLIYLCTQAAMVLSFLCGRLVPLPVLANVFRVLKLQRAQRLLEDLGTAEPADRLEYLSRQLPSGWIGGVLKHRYLTLAVVLNMPGNSIVGGAGGIGLIAGASRLFSFPRYCLLIAAATSPLPLLLLLRGGDLV